MSVFSAFLSFCFLILLIRKELHFQQLNFLLCLACCQALLTQSETVGWEVSEMLYLFTPLLSHL